MIKVKKVYIDICDNFKYFLRLNNKRLKGRKLSRYFLYYKFIFLKHIKFCAKIKQRRKDLIIIYSNKTDNILKKIERIIKYEKDIVFSNDILEIIKKIPNKSENICIILNNIRNNKIEFWKNIKEVLQYTMKRKSIKLEQSRIYILIKKYNNIYDKNIINISRICNSINIVTANIGEFVRLEKIINEEIGPVITISNNKRKSVSKAKYIINIDFNEKDINKYNLSRNAIIFNISQNKLEKLKCFDGIIINNVDFIEKDNSLTMMINRRLNEIYDNNFVIKCLIGNNGKIANL